MDKIIIAAVAFIVIGGSAYAVKKNNDNHSSKAPSVPAVSSGQNESAKGATQNTLDPNNYTEGANIGDTVNGVGKSQVGISINDFIFKTTYLKIKKGVKVTWTNDGQISHTVTSAETSAKKGLSSGMLANSASYSFTFNETGVYEYYCSMHPDQMKAVITVVD